MDCSHVTHSHIANRSSGFRLLSHLPSHRYFRDSYLFGDRQSRPLITQDVGTSAEGLKPDIPTPLNLREAQTILLSPPSSNRLCLNLAFNTGIGRISGSFCNEYDDITLGFCGSRKSEWVRFPIATTLVFEALSGCQLDLQYVEHCPTHQDLLMQWLFDFHLVRHPVRANHRLISLFRILVKHFGVKQVNSYLLPFRKRHERIAELIGTTRSTATRQINFLRDEKRLLLGHRDGKFIFSEELMNQTSEGTYFE